MKLYNPEKADTYVFAVVPVGAKEGTDPTYVAVKADGIEEAENSLLASRPPMKNAYPHAMGRYDEIGRYMTYQPPVEGIRPGKFILHPIAQQEYQEARAF
jgi:hypothetical protein